MSNKAVRVLGIVALSATYWLAAFALIGVMQMGDCLTAACTRSKDAVSIIILVAAAVIYALALHFNSRAPTK